MSKVPGICFLTQLRTASKTSPDGGDLGSLSASMSLVRKQKILSFCTGVAVAGAAYVSTQKLLWRQAADLADHTRGSQPKTNKAKPTLVDEHYREQAIRQWNQAVDRAFRPMIEALSKRNL